MENWVSLVGSGADKCFSCTYAGFLIIIGHDQVLLHYRNRGCLHPCRWRSPDLHRTGSGAFSSVVCGLITNGKEQALLPDRACPSLAFSCLKQDGQDCQDGQDVQDEAARTQCKGLEDLNVYRTSAQHGEKVREDLNSYRLKQDGQDLQDGTG